MKAKKSIRQRFSMKNKEATNESKK